MAVDVSAFAYFAPILAFLVVFAIMAAILNKTKMLGENLYVQIFVAFVIATVFITAGSVRQLVLNVIPWFAVLLIALFMILFLVGFMNKTDAIVGKGLGWVFVILLIIIFLVSGVKVFSSSVGPYLPTASYEEVYEQGDPQLVEFFSWLYSPRVTGFFLLIGVAALVTWVLVKNWKK